VRHTFENGYGLYFQDSYHVTPRVTLNYGLRWDYSGVVAEKNHLFSNFITTSATVGNLVRVGPGGLSKLYNPDYKNFAPRASIAWDVFGTGKMVVRSGYGVFFDAFFPGYVSGAPALSDLYAPGRHITILDRIQSKRPYSTCPPGRSNPTRPFMEPQAAVAVLSATFSVSTAISRCLTWRITT